MNVFGFLCNFINTIRMEKEEKIFSSSWCSISRCSSSIDVNFHIVRWEEVKESINQIHFSLNWNSFLWKMWLKFNLHLVPLELYSSLCRRYCISPETKEKWEKNIVGEMNNWCVAWRWMCECVDDKELPTFCLNLFKLLW